VSAARAGSGRRWPALVLLVAVLIAGIVVQRQRDQQAPVSSPTPPQLLLPTAAGPAALSSTWYCAAGSATGASSGVAEQTVVIENASDRSLGGRITVMTDSGKSVTRGLAIGARARTQVRVSDLVTAPYAAAVVEVAGGQVAVSHLLQGPTGVATAACSSVPSANWYVPSGTSRPGTRQLLALFNPFPSDAIATVTFETDDGLRSPQAFDGLVVPGGQVLVLDVSAVVTLRTQIATTVAVREGRLIVDQVQTADGSAGTAKGLAVTPAAPRGAATWWFADGPATPGAKTSLAVQNPGTQPVKVSVSVRLDQAAQNGTVSPFVTTVAPGGYSLIDVSGGRIPVGVGFTAVARSAGDQSIVVDRFVTAVPPASPAGFDVTLGSPVVAGRWLVPVASSSTATDATLVVANPSSQRPVRITVSTVAGGAAATLTGLANIVTIPAGGRSSFTVPTGPKAPEAAITVDAGGPIVVEERFDFTGGGLSSALAVPLASTASTSAPGRF
jgi:hypothetical protein